MWWLLAACRDAVPPTAPGDSGWPLGADTVSAPAPFAPTDPECPPPFALPSGWDAVRYVREPWAGFALDGSDGHLVDRSGRQVDVADWTDVVAPALSAPPFENVSGLAEHDETLWALTEDVLAWFTGYAWQAVANPLQVAGSLVRRSDGTVAVLGRPVTDYPSVWRSSTTSYTYPTYQDLAIWDGETWATYRGEASHAFLYDFAETASGRLVGVGDDIREWEGADWSEPLSVAGTGAGGSVLVDVETSGETVVAVSGTTPTVVRGEILALVEETVGTGPFEAVSLSPDGTIAALTAWIDPELPQRVWRSHPDWTALTLPADGVWVDVAWIGGAILVAGDRDGPTVMEHSDADEWVTRYHQPALDRGLGVAVDGAGTVWLAGASRSARWADTFTVWPVAGGAVAAGAPDDALMVSGSTVWSWNGAGFTGRTIEGVGLHGVAIADDGAAYVHGTVAPAGDEPTLHEREGVDWVRSEYAGDPITDLHVASATFQVATTDRLDLVVALDGTWSEPIPYANAWLAWGRSPADLLFGGNLVAGGGSGLYSFHGKTADRVDLGGSILALAGDGQTQMATTDQALSILRDGVWTEVASSSVLCKAYGGVRGDAAVITVGDWVWRGPVSSLP